jgi:hypothetical protein
MVKRYFPAVCQPDNFTIYGRMREAESKEWGPEGGEWVSASDYDALAVRLAEAERLLDDAAEEFQLQHDPEDCIAMRNRILAFLRATASASVGKHDCPSCGCDAPKAIPE